MQSIIFSRASFEDRHAAVRTQFGDGLFSQALRYGAEKKKSRISIDQMRDLKKDVSIHPGVALRLFLLEDAQLLTIEAQQALLKIVEEPPTYAQIIFLVDHEQNLIETIRSRCVVHQVRFLENERKRDDDAYDTVIFDLLEMDLGARIDWVTSQKDALKKSEEAVVWCDSLVSVLRLLLLSSVGVFLSEHDADKKRLSRLSPFATAPEWESAIRLVSDTKEKMVRNYANSMLGIEMCLLTLPPCYTRST